MTTAPGSMASMVTPEDAIATLPAARARQRKAPEPKAERKKAGRKLDPDWPDAIAKVTQDCLAAGYKGQLKRGDKAAIQTMLLNFMAVKNKRFSDDAAAKHAEAVIAALAGD